jgi:hypothetical protein
MHMRGILSSMYHLHQWIFGMKGKKRGGIFAIWAKALSIFFHISGLNGLKEKTNFYFDQSIHLSNSLSLPHFSRNLLSISLSPSKLTITASYPNDYPFLIFHVISFQAHHHFPFLIFHVISFSLSPSKLILTLVSISIPITSTASLGFC